jgi:hypothetical protein
MVLEKQGAKLQKGKVMSMFSVNNGGRFEKLPDRHTATRVVETLDDVLPPKTAEKVDAMIGAPVVKTVDDAVKFGNDLRKYEADRRKNRSTETFFDGIRVIDFFARCGLGAYEDQELVDLTCEIVRSLEKKFPWADEAIIHLESLGLTDGKDNGDTLTTLTRIKGILDDQ